MNAREFYKVTGGNYESVLSRLGNLERVYMTLLDFTKDVSFDRLESSLRKKDIDSAMKYAQQLRKLAINLGFDRLYKRTFALSEMLAEKKIDVLLFERVSREYNKIVDNLRLLD